MENIALILNQTYCVLEEKLAELRSGLADRGYRLSWGFYNGHYRRDETGEYRRDAYPIPVISVKGCCDIEIQLDHVNVSAKLGREQALGYSFEGLHGFEAYGVENYTGDFFRDGMTVAEMKQNISESDEAEIGFAFPFPFGVSGGEIAEFEERIQTEGFYY